MLDAFPVFWLMCVGRETNSHYHAMENKDDAQRIGLAKLRIMATREKRRGGDGMGVKCVAKGKVFGGNRSFHSLDDVQKLPSGFALNTDLPSFPGVLVSTLFTSNSLAS